MEALEKNIFNIYLGLIILFFIIIAERSCYHEIGIALPYSGHCSGEPLRILRYELHAFNRSCFLQWRLADVVSPVGNGDI